MPRAGLGRQAAVDQIARCSWARTSLSIAYHDLEWGVPVHDDKILFELLTLEGAQAGLSWETILKKRESYRQAFVGFDPTQVARFGPAQVARLLRNPGIVRNRLKIRSTVANAKAFLEVQHEFGSFDAYVWSFVGGTPRLNRWKTLRQVPARTPESDALSRDLLKRGFRFVGSTICYAFMQAVGIVNDHTIDCFRYSRIQDVAKARPGGWHTVTPRIVVPDPEKFVRFLRDVFGASGDFHADRPAEMRIGDSVVMVSGNEQRDPIRAFLYVYVGDADATYRRALAAGAASLEEPTDTPYGDRRGMVRDGWGNLWQIATHRADT